MFVDAFFDRKKDLIKVVERVDGQRVYKEFPVEHVFYYEHPSGSHRTIFGDSCKKFTSPDGRKFKRELGRMSDKRIFESDINPVFRSLETHYRHCETPKLNISFFDIEAAFNLGRGGYAPTHDPFNEITGITVYNTWTDRLITLALIPPTLTVEQAEAIAERTEDTYVFDDERELLKTFIGVIEDADVLSGWNSEGYDIPYLVNRIVRLLGEDYARGLCLWNFKPREREYEKFKKKFKTYDLVGRVHLDYLLLYQKHNTQQLHSYRLDYVGEHEVGENKVPYEGTLDQLWREDFDKFIAYNRQDVALLAKIDRKKKFIDLANQVAHANCVPLKTTMGSVALVEQAIILEMHEMGFVVPDRKRTVEERDNPAPPVFDDDEDDEDDEGRTPVVGAYVADPVKGLHDYVGAIDVNSLYPHVLMSLNASPETIVGQFRPDETMSYIQKRVLELGPKKRAEAWEGIFNTLELGHVFAKDGAPLTVDFEDGRTLTKSGRDWYEYIFNPKNNLCVSANGTLFKTDRDGIIPLLLKKWYAQRKDMQKKAKEFSELAGGVEISDELAALLGGGSETE